MDLFMCVFSSYYYAHLSIFYSENHQEENMQLILSLLDVFFTLDIMKNFVTDYTSDGSNKPVRDLKKIATRYL